MSSTHTIAVFAMAPQNTPNYADSVEKYISNLALYAYVIVVIATTNTQCTFQETERIKVLQVSNEGLDFGLWRKGLKTITDRPKRLLLANDSCTLEGDLGPMLSQMTGLICGPTNSMEISEHLQSYFLCFNGLGVDIAINFLTQLQPEKMIRQEIINQGEIGISKLFLSKGHKLQTIWPRTMLEKYTKLHGNVSFFHSSLLLSLGCPLLKRKRDFKKTCVVYVLAHNVETMKEARVIEKRFAWAKAHMLEPMTPEKALWEHSFFLKMPEFISDYVGILGSRASQKIDLGSFNSAIQKLLHDSSVDVMHAMPLSKSLQHGTCQKHPNFNVLWSAIEAYALPLATAPEALCSYFVAKANIMRNYASVVSTIVPKLLSMPECKQDAKYKRMNASELQKACGHPWYPHTPFVLERFIVPHFLSLGLKIMSMNWTPVVPIAPLNVIPKVVCSGAIIESSLDSNYNFSKTLTKSIELAVSKSEGTCMVMMKDVRLCVPETVFDQAVKELSTSDLWDFACLGTYFKDRNALENCTFIRKSLNYFSIVGPHKLISSIILISNRGRILIDELQNRVPLDIILSRDSWVSYTWRRPKVWFHRTFLAAPQSIINHKWFINELNVAWSKALPSRQNDDFMPLDISIH